MDYNNCPRMGFYRYWLDGKGWVRKGIHWDLLMGTFCHSAICSVLMGNDVEASIGMAKTELIMNWMKEDPDRIQAQKVEAYTALGEGLVRAWVKQRAPIIQQYYEVVSVEQEYEVDLGDGIVLMVRPDVELRRKSDDEIWALEFKTTGYNGVDYLDSWRYSVQTLTHCLALDKKYKKPCAGVMMEFLYKGYKKKDAEGNDVFYSPLVRGYSAGPLPPFNEERIEWDSAFGKKKAYKAVNVWEKMSMQEWIDELPNEVLDEHLMTREIFRHQDELDRWVLQTRDAMKRIHWALMEMSEDLLREVFPARLDRYCYSNQYRRKCPYLEVCFNGMDIKEAGLFEERKPHHPMEMEE
jgi:hypothetical protein